MTHTFLLGDGGLSEAADAVVRVREHIEGMPETAATFASRHIDGGALSGIPREAVEFAGTWEAPKHATGKGLRYVNPGYCHASEYSDVWAECACGERIRAAKSNGEHGGSCMVWDRHEARAELSRRRYEALLRLARVGWRTPRVAARFGVSKNDVGSLAHEYGVSMSRLRDVYRREAAATYRELLDRGAHYQDVAEVYGHTAETLSRWASDRGY